MSKVKISEFNFDYAPMSDENVVRWLLENRHAVVSNIEYGDINEDAIITYADLDELIASAGLSAGQHKTVGLVMEGYTVSDISECYGGYRQTYVKFYSRAIKKICDACERLWSEFHGDRLARGLCY